MDELSRMLGDPWLRGMPSLTDHGLTHTTSLTALPPWPGLAALVNLARSSSVWRVADLAAPLDAVMLEPRAVARGSSIRIASASGCWRGCQWKGEPQSRMNDVIVYDADMACSGLPRNCPMSRSPGNSTRTWPR